MGQSCGNSHVNAPVAVVNTLPKQRQSRIDGITTVPDEVYFQFAKAGKQARDRGQHLITKDKSGSKRLSLTEQWK